MTNPGQNDAVRTAVNIIFNLSGAKQPLSTKHLSEIMELPDSTMNRYMATLKDRGFVAKIGGYWTLGIGALLLKNRATSTPVTDPTACDPLSSYKRIDAVNDMIDILTCLAEQASPISTQQLSKTLNLSDYKLERYLSTLEAQGVAACEKKRWTIGIQMVSIRHKFKIKLNHEVVKMREILDAIQSQELCECIGEV